MAAITNFVCWRNESRDSIPCNWNTWRYLLICCYCRRGRRVNRFCQIKERLLFFRISTEPPKHLLDQYICGHTHHWSQLVYSSASARWTASLFRLDALISNHNWLVSLQILHKPLKCYSKFVADNILKYFFFFFFFFWKKKKKRLDISHWLSVIFTKYQPLFCWKREYFKWSSAAILNGALTPVLLNRLRCHTYFQFSANQITWSSLLIQIHILNDKQCRSRSVGFFRSQLI